MCSIFLRVANFEKGVILNIFENVQSEFLVHPCNIRYKETSKVHNRTKEDDKSGKRKTRLAHGIYFAVGRMCDWNRQCMEISVYCRNVWGRHVCCLVSVFFDRYGRACDDNGVCSGPCQQKKRRARLQGIGAQGQ